MTRLAWALIVAGVVLYVQAWFSVATGYYVDALFQGLLMFVGFITASHCTDLDTA